MEIDVAAIGKKPLTLRQGLMYELNRQGLRDQVAVSLLGDGRLVLKLRTSAPTVAAATSGLPEHLRGLEFENDFVSISEEEWGKRFLLVLNPDGDGEWDYGNNATETLLDQQDPLCIWTHHHDDGDGSGDYLQSGRHRANRCGYYVSTLPVPQHLTIQVWDDPWSVEDEQVVRVALTEWQQLVGLAGDAVVVEDFEAWFVDAHPDRKSLAWDVDFGGLLGDRLGQELFESIDQYREYRATE